MFMRQVITGVWYDTSADMWSLACILFELLTGDLLFDPRYVSRAVAQVPQCAQAVPCVPVAKCIGGEVNSLHV